MDDNELDRLFGNDSDPEDTGSDELANGADDKSEKTETLEKETSDEPAEETGSVN